jgi:putative heme iron utilization protein
MSQSSPQLEYAQLITSQRIASLGTLRDGNPIVSMVPFAETRDLSSFLIHISRLAQHTQDILQNTRVGLMIAEPDDGSRNPQTLARASIQGTAVMIPRDSSTFDDLADLYLKKFPDSAMTFSLGDFELYRIGAISARFIAGFGKIFNFGTADFHEAATSRIRNQQK